MATLQELQDLFLVRGIPFRAPGFYDDPHFVQEERRDSRFIENYAEFIERMPFGEEYQQRARAVATRLSQFLFDRLSADGRMGACIDISGTLMRMLEREGLWAYMVGGGLGVEFPPASHLQSRHFKPIVHRRNRARTGHMWVRVPPFKVIDLSLPFQHWSQKQAAFVRDYIAFEEFAEAEIDPDDLLEADVIAEFVAHHRRPPQMRDIGRSTRETIERFPPFLVRDQNLTLKYIPTQPGAMDGSLEQMRNLCLEGRYPIDLWNDYRNLHPE